MTALVAAIALCACGGASKLSEAPRASSRTACFATRDAARAAGDVVYASTGKYPATFTDLTARTPPVLVPPKGVTVAGDTMNGKGWTLTMHGGGATAPTFTCATVVLG